MKDIVIYGAGGFGRETALLIQQINERTPQWNLVGFFDDGLPKNTRVDGHMVIGGKKEALNYRGSICLAVADPRMRINIFTEIQTNSKLNFPILIHPTVNKGSVTFNKIGKGCILTAGVILTTHVSIGDFSIINLSSTIGHDVALEEYTSIMPGCHISGNVRIGRGTLMGTGATILPNLEVGKNSIIGAGALVTKPFPPNSTLVGIPASSYSKL